MRPLNIQNSKCHLSALTLTLSEAPTGFLRRFWKIRNEMKLWTVVHLKKYHIDLTYIDVLLALHFRVHVKDLIQVYFDVLLKERR